MVRQGAVDHLRYVNLFSSTQSPAPSVEPKEAVGAEPDIDMNPQRMHDHYGKGVDDAFLRPHKRRRITSPTRLLTVKNLKESLIGEVYGLLGSQVVADLNGLSSLAE